MAKPKVDTETVVTLPGREAIGAALLADETVTVEALIEKARCSEAERSRIEKLASHLVRRARDGRREQGGVDSLLHEYGLSSEEGVLLLCLAEALLRIPDAATADRLIAGTIGSGDWARHLGHSDFLLVNASTWGLMLTGRIVDWGESQDTNLGSFVQRLIARSGEPVIRRALRQAMRILGHQFVLGETIKDALANGEAEAALGYRFSFDVLGEAARTDDDAKRHAARYREAAEAIAASAGDPQALTEDELHRRPGLSVKLSALHPRYQPSQQARLKDELVPRLSALAHQMRLAWLPLTIDAEEADRLDLSLELLGPLFADPALSGWNGLGLAVQAYSKRALKLIDWLAAVSQATGRRIPVRLVKGAYWDSEIKWAQEAGLAGYPVFTRKVNTDIAYLAASRALLARSDCFYPQFATHNAHTVAWIATIAGNRPYEFQRLYRHGRGSAPRGRASRGSGQAMPHLRAGRGYRDLLAYLVRRLLENGANTSFVNRLADDAAPIAAIVADPVEKAAALPDKPNPLIKPPPELFAPERRNSLGLPLFEPSVRAPLLRAMEAALASPAAANPIVSGEEVEEGGGVLDHLAARPPHGGWHLPHGGPPSHRPGARCGEGGQLANGIGSAVRRAHRCSTAPPICSRLTARGSWRLMVREAGKTIASAQGDLREAVDHPPCGGRGATAVRLRHASSRAHRQAQRALAGMAAACSRRSRRGISRSPSHRADRRRLAAGNAVVAKPAEQTPLTATCAVRPHASRRHSARPAAPSPGQR